MREKHLLAGALALSLGLHFVGSALFAAQPEETLIEASAGGGVTVVGSLHDLVAGTETATEAVEEPLPVAEPVPPREVVAPPVETATRREPVPPTPVAAQRPVAVPEVEAAPAQPGVTQETPVNAIAPSVLAPVAPAPQVAAPVEPAKVDPVGEESTSEPEAETVVAAVEPTAVEPVEPNDVEAVEDAVPVPTLKPEVPASFKSRPPVTERRERPVNQVSRQRRGAEENSRRGGERVTARTSASETGTGRSRSAEEGRAALTNYQGQVLRKLQRAKRYPRAAERARIGGTVTLRFTVSRSGQVSSSSIVGSSGHAVLDQEVLAMIARAAPMPAFPDAMKRGSMTFTVPVRFDPK